MGATKESSWSDGILEGWVVGEDAGACWENDTYASVSPGINAKAQTVATKTLNLVSPRFEFMRLLSARVEPIPIRYEVGTRSFEAIRRPKGSVGLTGSSRVVKPTLVALVRHVSCQKLQVRPFGEPSEGVDTRPEMMMKP